jgi:hypothetical protein
VTRCQKPGRVSSAVQRTTSPSFTAPEAGAKASAGAWLCTSIVHVALQYVADANQSLFFDLGGVIRCLPWNTQQCQWTVA